MNLNNLLEVFHLFPFDYFADQHKGFGQPHVTWLLEAFTYLIDKSIIFCAIDITKL